MTEAVKTINITNISKRQITLPGTIVLAPGETGPAPETVLDHVVVKAWIKAGELEQVKTKAKTEANPEGKADAGAADDTKLIAMHNGGGRYAIKRGKTVVAPIDKADAEAFNALSDEDKEAYVTTSKA
jgi:hypothetical protein